MKAAVVVGILVAVAGAGAIGYAVGRRSGLPNGRSRGRVAADFDAEELRRGTLVEREHTRDVRLAQRIAMDHLTEDPAYYRKLAKIHQD